MPSTRPTRSKTGEYRFSDHPEFTPNLSPREMFELGSFGGTYWRSIYSSVNKREYKNQHRQYPASWWAMKEIVRKGKGAYYSSGSRPNQTATSWARARLASALIGGPAAKVDWHIIKDGCKQKGKTRRLIRKKKVVKDA